MYDPGNLICHLDWNLKYYCWHGKWDTRWTGFVHRKGITDLNNLLYWIVNNNNNNKTHFYSMMITKRRVEFYFILYMGSTSCCYYIGFRVLLEVYMSLYRMRKTPNYYVSVYLCICVSCYFSFYLIMNAQA